MSAGNPPPSAFAFTTTRPVAVAMMMIAIVVFGFVGLRRLPVDLLPELSYPTITVRTQVPGASPEDVEERVTEALQEAVSVTAGVRRVVAISRAEVSDIVLDFDWGTSMTEAVPDVNERIQRVRLPTEAERPLVLRYDPSLAPAITFGLVGDLPLAELRRIAEDEIERELAKLDGVAAVKVRGGIEEEIRIEIDEAALGELKLDIATVSDRLQRENVNAASGSIDEGRTEFLVRMRGEFQNLEEIADIILERRGNAPIRLRDVARVRRVPRDRDVISRFDGSECVLIDVYKAAGSNLVALADVVRDRLFGSAAQQAYVAKLAKDGKPLAATGPPPSDPMAARMAEVKRQMVHRQMTDFVGWQLRDSGVRVEPLLDQSKFIRSAIAEVRDSAMVGGILAIVVILLFLRRIGPTLVLAVSIPISLIASFAPMFLSGVTLNVMSLGGLALGVGMLVDSSIVVLEAITRAREEGMSVRVAAVHGVSRVAGAVTASTLTTVAVFFPIVFVEGIAGQIFRDQSLTVVFSLLMSLVVALLLIPMLATRRDPDAWFQRAPTIPASRVGRATQRLGLAGTRAIAKGTSWLARIPAMLVAPVFWIFDRAYGAIEKSYPKLLAMTLRVRALVLLLALGLGYLAWEVGKTLDSDVLPQVAQGEFVVELFLPRDATVERTDAVCGPIERRIREMPEVESTFLAVGVDKDELNDAREGEHSAKILVRLRGVADPRSAETAVRERILTEFGRLPELAEPPGFAQAGSLSFDNPFTLELVGKDLIALRTASNEVEGILRTVPQLRDVRTTQQRGNPEIVLRLDRERMSALSLDSGIVTRILDSKVRGIIATRFPEHDRRIDMRVAMARSDIDRTQALLSINVNPRGTPAIPLESIASVEVQEGPSEIRRLGNTRGAVVEAGVRGFGFGAAADAAAVALADYSPPRGIEVRLGAGQVEMSESMDSVMLALALAIFLVYVVMACQFESIVQPFVILLTVPLAFIGVVFALRAIDMPVSIIAMLGGIVLAGIVVNNAIIMIDQINKLRQEGLDKRAAIVEGARSRLRPVLMTTLTTVLGLLPLTGWLTGLPWIGGSTEGIELRAPMAVTVVAGLSTSTLLTLFVIPCVYSFADRRA